MEEQKMSDERERKELEKELNEGMISLNPELEQELNNFEENEAKKEIASAENFDQLFNTIRQIGEIKGTSQTYPANDLITIINDVRNMNLELRSVTRTLELRKKVEQLLKTERGLK